jgi:hypothetical protein
MNGKLRSVIGITFLMVLGTLVILFISTFTLKGIEKMELSKGDIYYYEFNEDNPFEETYVKYLKVIDIKDDYVQYVDTVRNDTSSCSKGSFVRWNKKMK